MFFYRVQPQRQNGKIVLHFLNVHYTHVSLGFAPSELLATNPAKKEAAILRTQYKWLIQHVWCICLCDGERRRVRRCMFCSQKSTCIPHIQ